MTWRPSSGRAGLDYEAAVEEALCFGWVDSTGGRVDDDRGKLYFAPRKPRSVWAATNKARVERLIRDGRMMPAGLAVIERAKANGSWEVLDSVERLEVPADLAAALEASPPAAANFGAFPPSARKMHLAWVALARTTADARIADRDDRGGRRPQRTCPRMTTLAATDLEIHPLTPERFADLAALFEEGGDPKWCWCTYFRFRGRDWSNSTAAGNRAALGKLAARDDPAPGLVAYRDGRAVGWVSLGPREDYERLAFSKVLAPVDDTPVWSIVCFVVSREARGEGVASALLDAAIAYARAHRATTLEAYPVDTTDGRVPPANAFGGPLPIFERAGFAVVERRQWNKSTPVRPIVRLDLQKPREIWVDGARAEAHSLPTRRR